MTGHRLIATNETVFLFNQVHILHMPFHLIRLNLQCFENMWLFQFRLDFVWKKGKKRK